MTQDEIDSAKYPEAGAATAPTTFTDESIFCVDCGMEFIHTAADQSFFARMHYTNKPKRCVACRRVRKEERGGGAPSTGAPVPANDDEHYDIVCSSCGKSDRVPFQPKPGREVFCHGCHLARVKGKRGEGQERGRGQGKRARQDGCPARK